MTTTPEPVNPYTTPEAPAGGNTLARASFVLAIVLVVIAIVMSIFNRFVPAVMYDLALSASAIGVVYAVISVINLILGVFALALGFAGARRPGLLLQAGIGVGVGGFVAISNLVSLLSAPISMLVS